MKTPTENPISGLKICGHCGRLLPCDSFHGCGNTDDGLRHICKECEEQLRLLAAANPSMRVCRSCGRLLPLSAFRKNATRNDGYHPECKECCRSRCKKWHDGQKRPAGAIYKAKSGRLMVFDGEKSEIYWTKPMLDEIMKIKDGAATIDVAASLGLSIDYVRRKAKELGIFRPLSKIHDPHAVMFIKLNYASMSNKEIAEALDLTERQVVSVAQREKLKKSKEYQREVYLRNVERANKCNRERKREKKEEHGICISSTIPNVSLDYLYIINKG